MGASAKAKAAAAKPEVKKWATAYPELGIGPVPIEPCISPDYFERERRQIFRRTWLYVGRVEEIPNPGDYFVKDIAVASASVIIVRGRDGQIRAFHNMCAHRGNKMVWDHTGSCNSFVCRFHGWVYGLEGQLSSVRDEGQFHDFRKADHSLTSVAIDSWEGFIFVNFDPNPSESLTEFLGEFGEEVGGWGFSEKTSCFSYKAEVNCNWKIFLNAFQESYHVPTVHHRTVPDSASSASNPFARPVSFILYPRHQVISIYANRKPRLSPIDELVARYGPNYRKRLETAEDLPPGVNPSRSKEWGFDLNTVFPNFVMILWANGMFFTYNFWPLAVNRTLYEVRMYNRPAQNAAEKFCHEYNRAVLRTALKEDLSTMEQIQPMLESGAKSHFILQDNEIAVRHHYKVVDDFVQTPEAT